MKRLIKTAYARNMWRLMEKFSVLPTSPEWQALTSEMVDFMLLQMEQDAKEANQRAKGVKPSDAFEDDNPLWDKGELSDEELDALMGEDDSEHIREQMKKLVGVDGTNPVKEEDKEVETEFTDVKEMNQYLEKNKLDETDIQEKLRREELDRALDEKLAKAYELAGTKNPFAKGNTSPNSQSSNTGENRSSQTHYHSELEKDIDDSDFEEDWDYTDI